MKSQKYTNQLVNETSPYLLQHAHNPVNWYPWNDETLDKAKRENKPIIVSVGYAACHWCHVMERESFENEDVAKIMNEEYIPIKVDREERPDIDQVYMNAVQLITGSGGWPLNCIALPDGRPIYGGTYFPKDNWIAVLSQVKAFITEQPDKAEAQAKALTEGVRKSEEVFIPESTEFFNFNPDNLFKNWKPSLDYKLGGQKGAPKFPLPVGLLYLLFWYHKSDDNDALQYIDITLKKMAHGGIYDQIGGGFARYSVDDRWIVPHFEKMLYDNGQLVSLYSRAYQLTKNPLFKRIVYETLDFTMREMASNEGGFYSSYDADSEGKEGTFYIWKEKEFRETLNKDLTTEEIKSVTDYFSVTKRGNWENGENILFISDEPENIAGRHGISLNKLEAIVQKAGKILFEKRSKREKPGLDDKILAGWNGLMLNGLVDAYRVFDDKKFLNAALSNANFLTTKLMDKNNRLFRNFKDGKATINGFLDDYVFVTEGLINLYQATFDEKWINIAMDLVRYSIDHFFDDEKKMFFYTSDLDRKLIVRKKEISDNVIPASNSQMALNLYILGNYFGLEEYIKISFDMVKSVTNNVEKSGTYCSNWAKLLLFFKYGTEDIAITGNQSEAFRREFDRKFLPFALFSGSITKSDLPVLKDRFVSGKTKIHVCRDKVCKRPVDSVSEAMSLIQS